MNFAPYLSLPPWRAVSINNTWELGESIRGYPCGEESDGGLGAGAVRKGECKGVGLGDKRDREEQKAWVLQPCPSYLLKEGGRKGGGRREVLEVSGVAHVMHHRREREEEGEDERMRELRGERNLRTWM